MNQRDAESYFNLGNDYYDKGLYDQAISEYNKALEINPMFGYAWNNEGVALYKLGRLEEAIACYDKALEIDVRFAQPWHNKGLALYTLGKSEEAILCYDNALEINPGYIEAWYYKGLVLGNIGKSQDAAACFEKVLEINPKDADAWYNKGSNLFDLGKLEDAIACLNKALDINPMLASAWNNKGLALHYLRKFKEAITCFDKALNIDPIFAYAWCNKGDSLVSLGIIDDAVETYQRFIKHALPQDAHYVQRVKERIELLIAKREKIILGTGVLFWFNLQKISESGHSYYGAYIYKNLLPYFSPKRQLFPLHSFSFFDGDCLLKSSAQIPYDGPQERRILDKVNEQGINLCYIVAISGFGLVDFSVVDQGLRAANIIGYIGMTSCSNNDVNAFNELAKSMALPRAFMIIRGTQFLKESFGFVNDDELKSLGFNLISEK